MGNGTTTRLRGSSTAKVSLAWRPCALCQKGSDFHLHCQICCSPLEGFTRKTCPGECRKLLKAKRRQTRSVQCWVIPMDGTARKFRRWLPRRLAIPLHTTVFKVKEACRATIPKNPGQKPRGAGNA